MNIVDVKTFLNNGKNVAIIGLAFALAASILTPRPTQVVREITVPAPVVEIVSDFPVKAVPVMEAPKGNLFMIDLEKMNLTQNEPIKETVSKLNGKNLFSVRREDSQQNIFLTIYEDVEKLNHNKNAYEKYMADKNAAILKAATK